MTRSQAADTDDVTFPPVRADGIVRDGGVEGYRARRTLPIRVELGRQLRRRRTWVTFSLVVALPWLLLLAFELGDREPSGRGMAGIATTSGLNFALFTLYSSAGLLLIVVVALFFGDTVSSEASWSSLKYLLAAPVPRARLLRQKALAAAVLTILAIVLMSGMALLTGSLWYGTGDLLRLTGETVSFPFGLLCLLGSVGYLVVHLSWVAGLALWLGVSTDGPLGAVGGAVLVSILSRILEQITALGPARTYLPTHYLTVWSDLLSTDLDWTATAFGLFSGLAYATAFVLLALWRFTGKDITS